MLSPSELRVYFSTALIPLFLVIGKVLEIVVIRQTYFPDEPISHLWGIIAVCCAVGGYLGACIWHRRLLWISEESE